MVAIARVDLVAALFGMRFGEVSALSAIVYGLVGAAGLYQALFWKRVQTRWMQPACHMHARYAPQFTDKEMNMLKMLAVGTRARRMASRRVDTAARRTQTKDIVDTAVAAGSFKTLAKALEAADLVETLKGAGPFTVFAPTDEAFAKLPAGTLDNAAQAREQGEAPAHSDVSRRAGKVMAADVVKLQLGQSRQRRHDHHQRRTAAASWSTTRTS